MGIRGLMTHLKPYTSSIRRERGHVTEDVSFTDNGLIIDGPSFAFWVYYDVVKSREKVGHCLELIPSYADLAKAAVEALQDFEAFGFTIKHLFFDGVLPASKTEVRYERLNTQLSTLRDIHNVSPEIAISYTAPCRARPGRSPPSTPFLVSAVLEALISSSYGDRVQVVLCEADIACALPGYSNEKDFILTNDTDLLLLNPPAGILFFNDISFSLRNGRRDILKCKCIYSQQFGLCVGATDLIHLGYFLSKDPFLPLAKSVEKLSKTTLSEEETAELSTFRMTYAPPASPLLELVTGTNSATVLQRTDPRVSELIHEAFTNKASKNPARVYLGTLIDDPTRASAWRSSTYIRNLAYSTLAHTFSPSEVTSSTTILEIDRRGARMSDIPVTLSTSHCSSREAIELLNSVRENRSIHSAASNTSQWRVFALLHTLHSDSAANRPLPTQAKLLRLVRNEQRRLSWADLHLGAEVEGALYSLRMLRQVLEFLQSWPWKTEPLGEELEGLLKELQTLPTIGEMMPLPGECLVAKDCGKSIVGQLREIYPPVVTQDVTSEGKSKKSKKRKKPTQPTMDKNNMYNILNQSE